jgi:hypothetical protein
MSQIIITESQLKRLQETYRPSEDTEQETLNEAWYNTAMEVLGLADPTGIVDIVNGISYFVQGDMLFGVLSIVSAIPYAGDAVAKPVMGALKLGSKSTKALQSALKTAQTAAKGSKQYDAALDTLRVLSKESGPVGKFLQAAGGATGWAQKVNKVLDMIPLGPFKGMKNALMDYITLLGRAGEKSVGLQSRLKVLLQAPSPANLTRNIPEIQKFLKTSKIFDAAALSKPGFLSQTFFGGIPRLFRSSDGRRLRILMQSTKWWLGFLDYIGLGNYVGVEEISKKMGDKEFIKKLEEYQSTPQSKEYFDQEFPEESQGQESQQSQPSQPQNTEANSSSNREVNDPLAKFLRNLLLGQLNPIPGV